MLAPHNSGYAAKEGMDGPTIVMVNTMIRSISKIDDYKMVSGAILRQCYLFFAIFLQESKNKKTKNKLEVARFNYTSACTLKANYITRQTLAA